MIGIKLAIIGGLCSVTQHTFALTDYYSFAKHNNNNNNNKIARCRILKLLFTKREDDFNLMKYNPKSRKWSIWCLADEYLFLFT